VLSTRGGPEVALVGVLGGQGPRLLQGDSPSILSDGELEEFGRLTATIEAELAGRLMLIEQVNGTNGC